MRKIIGIFLVFFIGFYFAASASAHQPRIAEEEVIYVENPEVSQAFYGELNGAPEIYIIDSDRNFRLYVGILSPDIPGADKDFSVRVAEQDTDQPFEYLLDASKSDWELFHEEFAKDDYFNGPELKDTSYEGELPRGVEVGAGKYQLTVFSPDNSGKYVLVVGEKEEFPPKEIWNTFKVLPKLKKDFWGKSYLSAFWNLIGLFFLIAIVIAVVIVLLLIWITKKVVKRYGKSRARRL
ncbi:MAG: hypothetical protein ACOZBH_04740 [Patescibacteria group bacterium]